MNIFNNLPNINCESSVITLNNNSIIRRVLRGISSAVQNDSKTQETSDNSNNNYLPSLDNNYNDLLDNNNTTSDNDIRQLNHNCFNNELCEVSLITASRQLGYYLALVDPEYFKAIGLKNVIIYNISNICNQLMLWRIDKAVITGLMYIPVLRPYKNSFLWTIMSMRIGYLFKQSVIDVINQKEIVRVNKKRIIASNLMVLGLKAFEASFILGLERSVYRNNTWLISFGILTASHFGYTKLMSYINDKFNGDFDDEIDNCGLYQPLYSDVMY